MSQGPKLSLPRHDGDGGRTPYVIALLVQIAIIGAVSSAVSVPLIYLVRYERAHPTVAEHVTYVNTAPVETPVRPPRDTAMARRTPPPASVPPPQVAPPSSPPAVPPATPPITIPLGVTPPVASGGGRDTSSKGNGGGGNARSVPGSFDPRLLGLGGPPNPDAPLRGSRPSNDSTMRAWVKEYWDSLAHAQGGPHKSPQDWTFDRNGKKYGLDPSYIYFGKYKLPTVLLALLPIYVQSNPTVGQRNRELDAMRTDIMFQAMRALNEDDFNAAVKALRDRKEAEHAAQVAKEKPPP